MSLGEFCFEVGIMNWVKHLTSPPHQLKYNALIGMLLLVFTTTIGGSQLIMENLKNFVGVLASILFYFIVTIKYLLYQYQQ